MISLLVLAGILIFSACETVGTPPEEPGVPESPLVLTENFSEGSPAPEAIRAPLRFLALGDSYTIGTNVPASERWPTQLKDSLEDRGIFYDTLYYVAQGGWRAQNVTWQLESLQLDSNWNMVSLLIGVNDAFIGTEPWAYEPFFEDLLQNAIALAQGDPSQVFCVTIPDYSYTPFGQSAPQPPEAISARLDQFNEVNNNLCSIYGVEVIDIVDISRMGLDFPELVAGDDLHPSGLQYKMWVDRIFPLAYDRALNMPAN